MRNTLIKRSLQFLTALVFVAFFASASFAQDGAALFNGNCTSCHAVGKEVLGPDLKDVSKRRQIDWILKWVKNSSAVIASGDPYANALFAKFNKTVMPAQSLKDDEIKAIVAYIDAESLKAPKAKIAQGPVAGKPEDDNTGVYLFLAAIVLLIVVLVLGKAVKGLKKVVRVKEGLPPAIERKPLPALWFWMRNHKKIVAIILIVFMSWSTVAGWNTLWNIGVTTGYQPDQPIAFSHKVHAGDNGINCVYCHSGAEKSKTAGIPTANVCMNCHKGIKESDLQLENGAVATDEIGKIYKALDYNPSTQVYGNNPKPIEWVRVHNLQDFVYFNHSQHVKVGQIACQTCHGEVQEMTSAKQYSKLTMGWCIDCHLATPVQVKGNHYYDNIVNYYNMPDTVPGHQHLMKPDTIKVVNIGGTECARCHY